MNTKLIGAFGVAIIAAAAWYFTQDATPPQNQADTANAPAAEPGAPLADVVIPAEFSPLERQGETFFNAVCAVCHGANAAGQSGIAPPLVHRTYAPNHHADIAFLIAARSGVRSHHWPFGDMPPVPQAMTDAELGAIVAYVRALQRANGIA